MNYKYSEAKKHECQPNVFVRLKYERKYYRCEYYDGMRISFDSIPLGKHRYETRHSDDNVTYPVSIAIEGIPVIVNFCGTIVSDVPIRLDDEKQVMEILYEGDCRKSQAMAKCYNPI